MIQLAEAYVERKVLTSFIKAIANAEPELQQTLRPLRNLYALSTLEKNKGWFLEQGYFHSSKSKAIRKSVDKLCGEVRLNAGDLVAAFGIPEKCLGNIGKAEY